MTFTFAERQCFVFKLFAPSLNLLMCTSLLQDYETMVTGDVARLTKHPFGLDDTVSTWWEAVAHTFDSIHHCHFTDLSPGF